MRTTSQFRLKLTFHSGNSQQNDERMWRGTVHPQSYATFFRHSAVLSVPALLLRKLPIIGTRKRQTATPAKKINSEKFSCNIIFFQRVWLRPLIASLTKRSNMIGC